MPIVDKCYKDGQRIQIKPNSLSKNGLTVALIAPVNHRDFWRGRMKSSVRQGITHRRLSSRTDIYLKRGTAELLYMALDEYLFGKE